MYYCLQVFPAKEVYLYMGSRSSVSRNARATWCMKYFNKVLPSRAKDEEVLCDVNLIQLLINSAVRIFVILNRIE